MNGQLMKRLLNICLLAALALVLCGCCVSRNATISRYGFLEGYRYALVMPPSISAIHSTNLVCGQLLNHGFVIVPELTDAIKDRTIIVNFGESSKDWVQTSYVTDISVQISDAVTYEVLCTASAEGSAQICGDDVRAAVNRCFMEIFSDDCLQQK